MKKLLCGLSALIPMSLAAQSWIIDGQHYATNGETKFFPELGLLQTQNPQLESLYISRQNTTPFAAFQIGGPPAPTFVPGYLKLDQNYYQITGTVEIRARQIILRDVGLVNCRRSNNQPLPTNGAAHLFYLPFQSAIPLSGWQFMYFYAEATVYAMTTSTGDVICNQAVTPTLTPIVEASLFKQGFE